jgi:hypothetical protein
MSIEAGASAKDITPFFEEYVDEDGNHRYSEGEPYDDINGNGKLDTLWLGGFGARNPTGVHDNLWARTVALSFDGTIFTFTSVDAIGVSMKRVDEMREKALHLLGNRSGISFDCMIVASTHTHQGPDTIGIFSDDILKPGWDEGYLRFLVDRGAHSIAEAVERLEPAELIITKTEAGEGFVRDNVKPDIIDPYVGIIQARKPGGAAIATLLSIANHPEAAGSANTLVSSDYCHYLRSSLEEEFGGVAVHFSADLGLMQAPAPLGERGFERAQLIGEAYGRKTIDALSAAKPVPKENLNLRYEVSNITAPLEQFYMFLGVNLNIIEGYQDYLHDPESAHCAMLNFDDGQCTKAYGCFDVPVTVMVLGDELTLVTLPGEVTPELVVGGIAPSPEYEGLCPNAPSEPVMLDHIETSYRFIIGLAMAEIGYIYPKITYNPEECVYQEESAGPSMSFYLISGITEMMDRLNALRLQHYHKNK